MALAHIPVLTSQLAVQQSELAVHAAPTRRQAAASPPVFAPPAFAPPAFAPPLPPFELPPPPFEPPSVPGPPPEDESEPRLLSGSVAAVPALPPVPMPFEPHPAM
jgi:hypothetical protein